MKVEMGWAYSTHGRK